MGEDTLYGVYPDTGEIHLIGGSLRLTSLGRSTARINLQVRSRLDMSEGLRTSITVEQTNKDANVIAIGYAGPDSLNVLKIPNAVAYRFVTARGVDQVSAAKAQTRYLKDQEIALETDAASYEAQVQDFLEKHHQYIISMLLFFPHQVLMMNFLHPLHQKSNVVFLA